MKQIVHQKHRAVEGADGADLVVERAVARQGADGKVVDILAVDLVGVQALGHGARDDLARKQLAVGYAHGLAQPLAGGGRIDLAHAGEQALVQKLGVKAQKQPAREQARNGLPEPWPRGKDGGKDLFVRGVGLFEALAHVLHQHHRRAQIGKPKRLAPRDGQKAELGQKLTQRRGRIVAQRVAVVAGETAHKQLVAQNAQCVVVLRAAMLGGEQPQKLA